MAHDSAIDRSTSAHEGAADLSLRADKIGPLHARLACPICRNSIALPAYRNSANPGNAMAPKYRCQSCEVDFPAATCGERTIPWLFPHPELAHLEWSARFRGYLQQISSQHNGLNRSLNDTRLSETGKRRIAHALGAKREHQRQVSELLGPIGLNADDLVPAMTRLLDQCLPKNQGLLSYADNVFRDWAWDNGENEASLSAIDGLISSDTRHNLGATLTLGAGAGRLAYDIHRRYSPELSVLLDFNPLLLSVGNQVSQGKEVSLYEFPVAPIDDAACAVLQRCFAPEPLDHKHDFHFVFGDATNAPFADSSFDTIVTPWLIDILPQDLREFVPQVNRLLPTGGLWVNTGSLAFFHDDPCCRYSEKEVLEVVSACGFEIVGIDHRSIPYLQSPNSAHGRLERIVSFTARKRASILAPMTSKLSPKWLCDTSISVPTCAETTVASSTHLLTAQVLAAIDGKRSIDAITHLVSREYKLSHDECAIAVRRIVLDNVKK